MTPEKKQEIGRLLFWISCVPLLGILIVLYFLFQMISPEGIGRIMEKCQFLFPTYTALAITCLLWHSITRQEKWKRYAFGHISVVGLAGVYLLGVLIYT